MRVSQSFATAVGTAIATAVLGGAVLLGIGWTATAHSGPAAGIAHVAVVAPAATATSSADPNDNDPWD